MDFSVIPSIQDSYIQDLGYNNDSFMNYDDDLDNLSFLSSIRRQRDTSIDRQDRVSFSLSGVGGINRISTKPTLSNMNGFGMMGNDGGNSIKSIGSINIHADDDFDDDLDLLDDILDDEVGFGDTSGADGNGNGKKFGDNHSDGIGVQIGFGFDDDDSSYDGSDENNLDKDKKNKKSGKNNYYDDYDYYDDDDDDDGELISISHLVTEQKQAKRKAELAAVPIAGITTITEENEHSNEDDDDDDDDNDDDSSNKNGHKS